MASIYSTKSRQAKNLIALFLILAAAILAAWPLFQPGFIPTHDGEYHIIRFWQFEKVLRAGSIIPRWAPDLNSGYGVPIFIFNYPLPNYLGAFFHALGASYPDAFKLTLATGYLTATLFCFLWLRRFLGSWAATVGSIVFAYIPYWFVELYVRGSIGEVLAIAWLMIILWAVEASRSKVIALGIAGIVLSHNILATAFLPVIVGYGLIRKRSISLSGLLVGIGIAAYFWLPAILESGYVVGLNPVNFRDYFPSFDQLLIPTWGSGLAGARVTGNEMSPQIGLVPLGVILTTALLLWRRQDKEMRVLGLYFWGLVLTAFFLILPVSRSVWEIIPFLPLWQYPWRWLVLILPTTAFMAAFLIKHLPGKLWSSLVLIILAISLTYSYSRPVVYPSRDDAYYLSRSNFTDGTSSLGNAFSTRWSPAKNARPTQKIEILEGQAQIFNLSTETVGLTVNITAKTVAILRINILYYPGWQVKVDGEPVPINYQQDGTLVFSVSPGEHQIAASFHETPLRTIADTVSVLSLLVLTGSAILKKKL